MHGKLLRGQISASCDNFCGGVQGVSRLLQQGSNVRPTAAALAAAAAAQEKRVSPGRCAQQAAEAGAPYQRLGQRASIALALQLLQRVPKLLGRLAGGRQLGVQLGGLAPLLRGLQTDGS